MCIYSVLHVHPSFSQLTRTIVSFSSSCVDYKITIGFSSPLLSFLCLDIIFILLSALYYTYLLLSMNRHPEHFLTCGCRLTARRKLGSWRYQQCPREDGQIKPPINLYFAAAIQSQLSPLLARTIAGHSNCSGRTHRTRAEQKRFLIIIVTVKP